jgi:hypothetical protein
MTVVAAMRSRLWPSWKAGDSDVEQQARRNFLLGSLGVLITAASLPVLTLTAPRSYADSTPDPADLEIAALGAVLRKSLPDAAARTDAWARKEAGLAPGERVDWASAERARLLLTERSRVAAELDREEIVFVEGWLLTNSEAGATLLYAAALAQSTTPSQNRAAE